VPGSVTRRALQAARSGETASFFYVRRFTSGSGRDEYVVVTCRLTAGGVRSPLSLVAVTLRFAGELPSMTLARDGPLPPFSAEIQYTGTGRLKGRWEVAVPGDEPPRVEDLLTEAALPVESRGQQRRYAELERFNVFLPPTGRFTLRGALPAAAPTQVTGTYLILLRIEASDDTDGDSGLRPADASHGGVHTGATAGFPLPVLRYTVAESGANDSRQLLRPSSLESVLVTDSLDFTWQDVASSVVYRLEIDDGREVVLAALVPSGIRRYKAPPWIVAMLAITPLRSRIVALNEHGREIGASAWRDLKARLDR
jgi:hypothetical protein